MAKNLVYILSDIVCKGNNIKGIYTKKDPTTFDR